MVGTVIKVSVATSLNPSVVPDDLRLALTRVAALNKEVELLEETNSMLVQTNTTLYTRALAAEKKLKEAENTITQLQDRVASIEAQILSLPKTSTNSSNPPSTDKLGAARKYPAREKTGRSSGGQPGHKGAHSQRLEPTQTLIYTPKGVCPCGQNIEAGVLTSEHTRQLIGVDVKVTATDHVSQTVTCVCGQKHTGRVPAEIFEEKSSNPVMYDTSVKVLAVGLVECGQVPAKAAVRWLEGMVGVRLSEAVVRSWITDVAASLDGWDEQVVELLKTSPVVGADETPIKVEGYRNAYAHVAVTPSLTRFHLAGRGKKDIVAGGVLQNYGGTLVVDGLAAYRSIGVRMIQTCVGHLLRELRYHIEVFTPHNSTVAHPYPQLGQLHNVLAAAVHDPNGRKVEEWSAQIVAVCDEGLKTLEKENQSKPVKDTQVFLRRVKRNSVDGSLLQFIADPLVPATNNMSEQAVRPLKVRQRRAGTRRSIPHTRAGLRIAGYLDTARKNGVAPEKALKDALTGNPYIPTE